MRMNRLRHFLVLVFALLGVVRLQGQYISRSEPVPYNCPSVCASGRLILKIPQIQNLPNGAVIQAELSNASGSFASGTQILTSNSYSTNQGATWTPGVYNFSNNINDLFMEIIIPGATPPGNGYTIRMRSSSGYVANDLFQCSSSNTITITPFVPPLPGVAAGTPGNNQWFGHVYTWIATTGATLNTPALVNAQSFFLPANYKGHVIYNPLSFDVNFTNTGGIPGTANNGTSISCGDNYSQNFSMRLLRTENFTPGFYQFSIQGDDGIRFSLDGGLTWVLSAWQEQTYASSFRSTNAAFPNGICLSGPTDLVIEYFQRPADARMTFSVTPLGALNIGTPTDLSLCAGDNGSFSVGAPAAGLNYQWFVSTDNGNSFQAISNTGVYTGSTASTLSLTAVPGSFDGYQYYCEISGSCGNPLNTDTVSLTVASTPQITLQPQDAAYCAGQDIVFTAQVNGSGLFYQWLLSTDGGNTFTVLSNSALYSGVNTPQLTLTNPPASVTGYLFRLQVTGCGGGITSAVVEILPAAPLVLNAQPQNLSVCSGLPGSLSVSATGATAYQWQIDNGAGFINLTDNAAQGFQNTQTANLNVVSANLSPGVYSVRCLVSGGCSGDVASNTATISIIESLSIFNETGDQTACDGGSAGFSINASGAGITFQWQVSTDGGVTFNNLSNAAPYAQVNTDFLVINPVTAALDGAVYRCVVTGDCNSPLNSTPATLNIESAPTINIQPADAEACEGGSATFSAGGNGNGIWQWEISTDGGITFSPLSDGNGISGSTSSSLSLSNIPLSLNGAIFRVSFEACGAAVNSQAASLSLLPGVLINNFSASPPVCEGESAQFSVSASNATSYQWEINTGNGFAPLNNGNGVLGANTAVLSLDPVGNQFHTALFRCVVSGVCGEVSSTSASLFVNSLPAFIKQPDDLSVCSGSTLQLEARSSGEGISYAWQLKDENGEFVPLEEGGIFSGSNSPVLTIQAVNEANGLVLQCAISGCGSTLLSDTAKINILENDPVYIPNAFTPDEDQVNPEFKIYTAGNPTFTAMIYNRWGELLFEWKDKTLGWDGNYLNAPVSDGVYVYRVQVETACESRTYMGTLSLFR